MEKTTHVEPTKEPGAHRRADKAIEFVRSANNYDTNAVSKDTGLACRDVSLTQQQFKEESDINFIADRFGLNGELPELPADYNFSEAWGVNFEGIYDFQTAQDNLVRAREGFMGLPAEIRTHFDNDPAKFLQFAETLPDSDKNRKIAEAIGLITNVRAHDLGLPHHPQDRPQSPPGDAGKGPKGPGAPSPVPEAPASPTNTPGKPGPSS